MWCAVWSSEGCTELSCPGSLRSLMAVLFLQHCVTGIRGDSTVHCRGSRGKPAGTALLCQPRCFWAFQGICSARKTIKCNSSLFLRAVIMHSQTTNMGVECDGVNICCYYANYAFCVDIHVIVTNKTHLCCANSRVWVTPFFELHLYGSGAYY